MAKLNINNIVICVYCNCQIHDDELIIISESELYHKSCFQQYANFNYDDDWDWNYANEYDSYLDIKD